MRTDKDKDKQTPPQLVPLSPALQPQRWRVNWAYCAVGLLLLWLALPRTFQLLGLLHPGTTSSSLWTEDGSPSHRQTDPAYDITTMNAQPDVMGMRLGYEFVWAPVADDVSTHEDGSGPHRPRMVLAHRPVSREESARRTRDSVSLMMADDEAQQETAQFLASRPDVMDALLEHMQTPSGLLSLKTLSTDRPVEMLPTVNEHRFVPIAERDDYFRAVKSGGEVPRISLMPDHTDKSTVLTMAIMSSNAYAPSGENGWLDPEGFNTSISFGQGSKGLAGHVFTSQDDRVVVVAIKGTSPWLPVGADPSWDTDKYMDNWMFSCCCARVDATWRTICGCYAGFNATLGQSKCSAGCLQDEIPLEESYYNVARAILNQVRLVYPKSQIWFTGHSLGGALSSLMGVTIGAPVFAFESPGEKMYAARLGFVFQSKEDDGSNDSPTFTLGRLPTFHYGNVKDPIFLGQCVGRLSACYYGGYAMESKCHIANRCMFETADEQLDIQYHRIGHVITRLIVPADVAPGCKAVRYPSASSFSSSRSSMQHRPIDSEEEPPCIDCTDWQFV